MSEITERRAVDRDELIRDLVRRVQGLEARVQDLEKQPTAPRPVSLFEHIFGAWR